MRFPLRTRLNHPLGILSGVPFGVLQAFAFSAYTVWGLTAELYRSSHKLLPGVT